MLPSALLLHGWLLEVLNWARFRAIPVQDHYQPRFCSIAGTKATEKQQFGAERLSNSPTGLVNLSLLVRKLATKGLIFHFFGAADGTAQGEPATK